MLVLPKRPAWSLELSGMPVELRWGGEDHDLILTTTKKERELSTFQVDAGSFTVLGIGPAPVAQVGKQCPDTLDCLSLIRLK